MKFRVHVTLIASGGSAVETPFDNDLEAESLQAVLRFLADGLPHGRGQLGVTTVGVRVELLHPLPTPEAP